MLRDNKLYGRLPKSHFNETEVKFLGHVVSAQGLKVDPKKTEAINAWTPPHTITEVRSFLGMTTYFRKFVDHHD